MCEKIKDFYTSEETDGPKPDPGCDEGSNFILIFITLF